MRLQPAQIKGSSGVPGIQITQTAIRKSGGGFTTSNVIALYVLFEHKDQVKDWVKENGGSWQSAEKYWYVPFQSDAELLNLVSKIGREIPELVSAPGKARLFDSDALSDRLISALQSAFEPSNAPSPREDLTTALMQGGATTAQADAAWDWCQKNWHDPDLEMRISRFFSPKARPLVLSACQAIEASDDWLEKEDKILSAVEAEVIRDGDDAILEVDLYAVIQEDGSVEVVANQAGMGDFLPKENRKYIGGQGDLRWRYPAMNAQIRRAVDLVLDTSGEKA
jgi:hypothetical protein